MTNVTKLEVPRFSVAERDRRWIRVRKLMQAEGLDAIFVPPHTGDWDRYQANVRYLTGIGGNCAMAAAVFPLEGEVTAITGPDISKESWMGRQDFITDIRSIGPGWGYIDRIIERLRELHLEKACIGISGLSDNTRFPEGIFSHGMFVKLQEAFPEAQFKSATVLMEQAKFVKSEEEIAFLEKADAIVEDAIAVMLREALPGVPECRVYARMMESMIEQGGDLPTMILWSAGWPQPPSNQYMPTQRKLQSGDMILAEIEGRWAGYTAQITQPAFIGEVPSEYQAMFEVQQKAIAACYDILKPGSTIGDLARVSEESAKGSPYTCKIIMHGKGLGDDSPICVYKPRDERMKNWPIEVGSAFIIKPVVMKGEREKYVYWGDTVVATAQGARRLGKRKAEIARIG